jgi:CheY-like chemotaxis protein
MDRGRFRQILLNLVRNAIKFTHEGSVHVSLQVIRKEGGDLLDLRVSDTGVGIANEKRDVIFGPFQQADGAPDRKFEGSGLGLSIVERITTTMGGTVEVISELGAGSEFIIRLPLLPVCPSVVAAQNIHAAPHSVLDGVNVLLAEDNRVNQKIVQGFIKGSGVHLDVAGDGNEAMQLFAKGRYDAVLMDVSMPNRNGFDATRAIRAIEQSRASNPCPIIAYTANCGEDDQKKCYAAGMDDVLAKPASKQELASRLAHWISKSVAPDEGAVAS